MTELRFDHPPVAAVDLTVYFSPVQGLQVSHFSSLREAWRSEYPDTAELPPLRPQNRDGNETSVLRIDQAWPFPYLMFGKPDNSGTVALQNDRLTRSWRFTEDEAYPGFVALANDLEDRFGQFADVVKTETDQSIAITGAECTYRNKLDESLGIDALIGVLSGWPVGSKPSSRSYRYAGVRLHLCDEDDLNDCALWVSADVDDDGVQLVINSETENTGDETGLDGLQRAHEQLLKTFVELTSEEMHEKWGRTS